MEILNGEAVAKKCDYSFGDHFALWDSNLVGATFKYANAYNYEFLEKAKQFEGKVMTLYIDNLRLYPREVKTDTEADKKFVSYLMHTNNLLGLCSLLPRNRFIIFTGQEDTPVNNQIGVPFNVERIYAVNAEYNDKKVVPFPFGLQRKMNLTDNRLEVMKHNVDNYVDKKPSKLLYINCGIGRNIDRQYLANFETNDWITTRFDNDSKFFPYDKYQDYLDELKDHKFVICPLGHGMDCHRNWETLYMRRVPVMKKHPYMEKLMKDYPVLWVDDWPEITKELLEANNSIYQEVLKMDHKRLDLNEIFNNCVKI